MAKLGECFSVIRNGASIRQTDGAGGFPITRIETIADKTINREKFGYAGIYDLAQYRDYILQDGDILMSHINSEKHLGKVALYSKQDDEQIIHGMNLLMLRADTQKVIPEYAKYYFESQKFLRQIGRITKKSVNQASFTVTALKELEIPLASIIVQRDISEKLKKVDWLVSLRKQQLAKMDELVKARFVEMFGDPVVNSKRWPVETIENHIDLLTGFPFDSSGYVSKGVNICGGLIIMPQKIDWSACKHWPQITFRSKKVGQDTDGRSVHPKVSISLYSCFFLNKFSNHTFNLLSIVIPPVHYSPLLLYLAFFQLYIVLPKIFLHQCLFHQFQLFKALLYGLLLLVNTFHKGGKLILQFNRRNHNRITLYILWRYMRYKRPCNITMFIESSEKKGLHKVVLVYINSSNSGSSLN